MNDDKKFEVGNQVLMLTNYGLYLKDTVFKIEDVDVENKKVMLSSEWIPICYCTTFEEIQIEIADVLEDIEKRFAGSQNKNLSAALSGLRRRVMLLETLFEAIK